MNRSRNPEETREKILEVSFQLFKEKGYERTTILEIVERLEGLTRGAFYHHFKSKEDVLHALLEQRGDPKKQLEIVSSKKLTGLEKIKQMLISGYEELFKEEDGFTISHIYLDLLKEPRILADMIQEIQGENIQDLKLLIEEGMTDGSIKKQDSQMLTELILLFFSFWMIPTIYEVDDEAYEQKVLMVKEVLDGLGCPILDEKGLQMMEEMSVRYEKTKL